MKTRNKHLQKGVTDSYCFFFRYQEIILDNHFSVFIVWYVLNLEPGAKWGSNLMTPKNPPFSSLVPLASYYPIFILLKLDVPVHDCFVLKVTILDYLEISIACALVYYHAKK